MKNEKVIDMRGRACPEPVIETRKALGDIPSGTLDVRVDNEDSAENVRRTAKSLGLDVVVTKTSDSDFTVEIIKIGDPSREVPDTEPYLPACEIEVASKGTAVLIASETFGEGAKELGDILMRAFIKTLGQMKPHPSHIIFLNTGVKLVAEGSVLIADVKALETAGVDVQVCGTCLDYYHLKEKLKAGRVSNMFDIVSVLTTAARVVRP